MISQQSWQLYAYQRRPLVAAAAPAQYRAQPGYVRTADARHSTGSGEVIGASIVAFATHLVYYPLG